MGYELYIELREGCNVIWINNVLNLIPFIRIIIDVISFLYENFFYVWMMNGWINVDGKSYNFFY